MRLIHCPVASTICHHVECNKVPIGDLFYMWCFIRTEVFLYIPFILDFYLSRLVVGSLPHSKICGGHRFTRLARFYCVPTQGMTQYDPRDMDCMDLGQMRVLEHGVDAIWRVHADDIMDPIL